jgi:hypothetical protein
VVSIPSAAERDPGVSAGETSWQAQWAAGLSLEAQAESAKAIIDLAVSCPEVRSVTWDCWSEAEAHLTPWSGLVDREGKAKPCLARLGTIRSAYLR